ncbi:DUF4190 domain-containing protein [Streptomyces sp. 8N616]|uniref:DUF4190 domain-containing protein n=1 Tax=Streptomyces sp. 8N616 TaxID=3457414 RepID=UPI003FD4F289
MSDNTAKPGQPGPRDPWAPPEQQVPLDKPRQGIPPVAEQPTITAMPSPGGHQQQVPPQGGSGAVPPPPIAPTGPGSYSYPPPYGADPYGTTGYGSGSPYAGYPAYPGYSGGGYGSGWHPGPPAPSNGMGVAGLVLGIIGAVLFFTNVLAMILGVLAIIFGALGRGKATRGEATNGGQALAGLILGIVAVVAGALTLVVIINNAQEENVDSSSDGSVSTSLVVERAGG